MVAIVRKQIDLSNAKIDATPILINSYQLDFHNLTNTINITEITSDQRAVSRVVKIVKTQIGNMHKSFDVVIEQFHKNSKLSHCIDSRREIFSLLCQFAHVTTFKPGHHIAAGIIGTTFAS